MQLRPLPCREPPTIVITTLEHEVNDQAVRALAASNRLFRTHESAWIAALLTPFARLAIDGPAPLILIDASLPGTGKTLLGDIIGMIVTGEALPRLPPCRSEEEERKRITSLALGGKRLAFLDNAAGVFGSPTFDAALTATRWEDRLLGQNTIVSVPLDVTWIVTGNNISLRGDTARRTLIIRLESKVDSPEHRTGFRHRDLLRTVLERRAELVAQCLVLLRYGITNPVQPLPAFGSFEGWSRVVRRALVAIGLPDPIEGRTAILRCSDDRRDAAFLLLAGMTELGIDESGAKTRQLIENAGRSRRLAEAIRELTGSERIPTGQELGAKLRALNGTVVDGRIFQPRGERDAHGVTWHFGRIGHPSMPGAGADDDHALPSDEETEVRV